MSEYERIVAAYDDNPKCHNYDFSVARARIAELEGQLADCAKTCGGLEYRLEQAEAETARLRGQFTIAWCLYLQSAEADLRELLEDEGAV